MSSIWLLVVVEVVVLAHGIMDMDLVEVELEAIEQMEPMTIL